MRVTKQYRRTSTRNRQKVRITEILHFSIRMALVIAVTKYVLDKGTLPRHETNGVNMRQSISELDSLLDDLNHAQKVGFSNSGVNRHEITTTESSM